MKNFNKICSTADWNDPELLEMMRDILYPGTGEDVKLKNRHRKHWEWAIGMLSLKKTGKLDSGSVILGIGSGSEAPVFYLTNHAKYVFCTDLYTITSGRWKEADSSMLTGPEHFSPGKFNRRRLGVQVMSGTEINFEDNTFDAVFSYSSIEHFGGKEAAVKCMKEIERVLKPGGIASIATEIYAGNELEKLYRSREKYGRFPNHLLRRYKIFSEMFTCEELEKYLLTSTNMKPLFPVNFSTDTDDLKGAIKYPVTRDHNTHIFLDMKGILWGSIHIALIKQ
ncbi:class I SAM-dependent methyltransferase [Methanosarcina mazei]|nr:class I SAM-dependent methyltransferase [Methanosarcina mazei]